jgi:peptide/nickel transport system ATP-binding protein
VQPHAPILSARELSKTYTRPGLFGTSRRVQALERVSLTAPRGATLAIVGESGSGKSTFAKVLTGLERADSGELRFDGIELAGVTIDQRTRQITRRLQMVFQNPDATLNPSHSVGFAIGRAVKRLKGLRGAPVHDAVGRLLDVVKLPRDHAARLPRQLSGGQKQRVAIARALAGDPDLVIADEPVSALDVSVQAAIINLMLEIQSEREMTLVFISHDLAVVRYLADMVAVMFLGKVVEFGSAEQVFAPPWHPYTEALLSAAPDPDPDAARHRIVLEGPPPSTLHRPKGCVFATRCHRKLGPVCDDEPPPETTIGGHRIACHIPAADLSHAAPVANPAISPERLPRPAP